MNKTSIRYDLGKIWIAGHTGMIGSALYRKLKPSCNVLTSTHQEVDLTRQQDVESWVSQNRPDTIFLCAAKVGGIHANSQYPADFIYQNLSIQTNTIEAARKFGVRKFIFLGSSCSYPKNAKQPIAEDALLTGIPEITNIWYSVAKIAGIKLIEAYRKQYGLDYIAAMPTNCYGPGDNFDPLSSHVIPALFHKMHNARMSGAEKVQLWGTGTPMREFIYVDDLADALIFITQVPDCPALINIGTSHEFSIKALSQRIASVVGYTGSIEFDSTRPDGAQRKKLETTRINGLGWSPSVELDEGLLKTYEWYTSEVLGAKYDM